MLKQSLILITLASLLGQIAKPSSCSHKEVEQKRHADFYANALFQNLSTPQQQLLVSAIQASIAEARLRDEKREYFLKYTRNDPKVIQAVAAIQKANIQRATMLPEILYELLECMPRDLTHLIAVYARPYSNGDIKKSGENNAQELDALTTTIMKQIATNTKTNTLSPTTSTRFPWQNSLTSLEQTLCSIDYPLHLSRYEFAKLFTESFKSLDSGISVNPALAPLFDLTIPMPMASCRTCCINAQSALVALAGDDGTLQIRSLIDGKKRFSFSHDGPVNCCEFALDSTWIAVGTNTGVITTWSLTTGKKIKENHTDQAINSLWINPQTMVITACHPGNILTRWNLKNGTWQVISFQHMPILALDSDQTHCAIYHNQEVHIVRLEDQAIITSLHTGPLTSAHFGYDDSSLICLSADKHELVIWDLVSGESTPFIEEDSPITCFALAKTAPWIIFGLENGKTWRVNYQGKGEYWPLSGAITSVAISADGSRAVSVSSEYEIVVTDSKQEKFLYAKKQLTENDNSDHILTPDGQYLISTYDNKGHNASLTIHMFDEQALKLLRECSAGQIELIEDLAALTLTEQATQTPLLTRKERVKLTAYQSALFHFLPDFIKQVLLRTNRILITPAAEVTKVVEKS